LGGADWPLLAGEDVPKTVQFARWNLITSAYDCTASATQALDAPISPEGLILVEARLDHVPANDFQIMAGWISHAQGKIEDELVDV
jgi:hypothetical protein